MGELNQEIAALRAEVERLRAEIDAMDDWAHGVHVSLAAVLPLLLRGHAEADAARRFLQSHADRYEELLRHPERAEEGETAAQHESPKILYDQLELLGVWPGVDPKEAARKHIAKFRRESE
jgi:uncharacterized small protein (DUF1192 family)